MMKLASVVTALIAVVLTACAVEVSDDATSGPGTDGKADGAGQLAGDFTKLYFEGGTLTESGTLQLIPLSGKIRMRLTATDHTAHPAAEGTVVDEDFVLDQDNFAERSFGADCTLYIQYLRGEFDIHQQGLCRDHVAAGVLLNGRYKRSYATGEVVSYIGGDDPANAMTLVWMGSRLEFHLGSGEAMAAGVVEGASPTRPVIYQRDNCMLTFTFGDDADALDVSQAGTCGIGGGSYAMHWTRS